MRRFHRSAAEVKMWRSPSERSERSALRRVIRRWLAMIEKGAEARTAEAIIRLFSFFKTKKYFLQ